MRQPITIFWLFDWWALLYILSLVLCSKYNIYFDYNIGLSIPLIVYNTVFLHHGHYLSAAPSKGLHLITHLEESLNLNRHSLPTKDLKVISGRYLPEKPHHDLPGVSFSNHRHQDLGGRCKYTAKAFQEVFDPDATELCIPKGITPTFIMSSCPYLWSVPRDRTDLIPRHKKSLNVEFLSWISLAYPSFAVTDVR